MSERAARSPLVRRVAAAVFLSVLFIETIIFVPSAIKLENQLSEALHADAAALFDVLSATATQDKDALFRAASGIAKVDTVKGVAIAFDDGTPPFRFGDSPSNPQFLPPGADPKDTVDETTHSRDMSRTGRGDGYNFTLVLRYDSEAIPTAVREFALRIGSLTFLICLFATAVVMAVLSRQVLSPIIDLRESLVTSKGDVARLKLAASNLDRTDEIGDLFRSVSDRTMEIAGKIHEITALARFPSENPNPVLRISRDGTIIMANPASMSIPELFADTGRKVISPALQPAGRTAFLTAERQSERLVLGGRTFQFDVNHVPGANYINIYGRDITDQVAAEAHLLAANATLEEEVARRTESLRMNEATLTQNILELEVSRNALQRRTRELTELAEKYNTETERALASEKAKSEFLATMSHEIRTPMTGILGLADILLQGELTLEQRELVKNMKGAGDSLMTIINDILDLSKIQAGKLEIEHIDFDLMTVVKDALNLVRQTAEKKGLIVALQVEADLPVAVRADPTRIRQVLINLLGNAVKFTHKGSVKLAITHEDCDDGDIKLQVYVIDTGIGIPEEVCSRLFEDFAQGDASTSRQFEGSGLGLAISKRLCALMGGDIGVVSTPGEGSTFWFTLTVKPAENAVEFKSTASSDVSYAASRPLNILLAEDNALNQMILKTFLEPIGHAVTIAENGLEAAAAVEQNDFDLVLMDIRMPEMNGPDATRVIRQLPAPRGTVPVIAVTADALTEHVDDYLAAGMTACVTKPINRAELIAAIDEVMHEPIHSEIRQAAKPDAEEPDPTDEYEEDTEPSSAVLDFLSELDDFVENKEENG